MIIIGFANSVDPDELAHNEPSHQDLHCLTFSLSTLQRNFFPIDSLFKKKKKKKIEDKCSLKFGTKTVMVSEYFELVQYLTKIVGLL